MSGISASRILGIRPCTFSNTWFIIFVLNCSLLRYLYPKNAEIKVLTMSINEAILKILEIFWNMIKEQITRATALMSVVVLLLIVALSPLYVTMSLMTRQMQESKR